MNQKDVLVIFGLEGIIIIAHLVGMVEVIKTGSIDHSHGMVGRKQLAQTLEFQLA